MDLYEYMPDSLCKQLHGVTINQALEQRIIDDLGDENGNFIFHSRHDPNLLLAIVQHYKIQCSEPLTQEYSSEELLNIIGDLSFFRFPANGKYECRLCKPNGIKLGKPFLTLDPSYFVEDNNSSKFVRLKPLDKPPNNPSKGVLYFDAGINKLRCYDGNSWQNCW